VATVVGTKVLKPIHALGIAASANFAGPFVFGTAVASKEEGKKIFDLFVSNDVFSKSDLCAMNHDSCCPW
jgi:phosphate/sulfate permease